MGKILGIDFGHSNTTVSYFSELGELRDIYSSEGIPYTPSVFFWDQPSNTVVIGENALWEGVLSPECVIKYVKRYFGSDVTLPIGERELSPVSVATMILTQVIRDAEEHFGDPDEIDGVILSCPAYFNGKMRDGLQRAAESVRKSNGQALQVFNIVDEPVAAAYAHYYVKHEAIYKRVLVYDLGGAFDVSVMDVDFDDEKTNIKLISVYGECMLGGQEWTERLKSYIISKFCEATGETEDELFSDTEFIENLRLDADKAKIRLSFRDKVSLTVMFNGIKEKIEITRDEFDEITADLLAATLCKVDEALEYKGLTEKDIDEVLIVGRASKMPQVARALETKFGKPVICENPDVLVSHGATLIAETHESERVERIVEDGVPRSLGILVQGGTIPRIVNVIKLGEPWTSRVTRSFYTATEDQRTILLRLFQNDSMEDEAEKWLYNDSYIPICVELSKGLPAGARVDVTFEFNSDKRLQLTVSEATTGAVTVLSPQLLKRGVEDELENILSRMYPGDNSFEPKEQVLGAYIGIDIGNHGCRVSYIDKDGNPVSAVLHKDSYDLPYVVTMDYRNSGDAVLFGEWPYDRPDRLFDEIIEKPKHWLSRAENIDEQGDGFPKPDKVLEELLCEAVRCAEKHLDGAPVLGAVIAVPPYFGASALKMLKETAGRVTLSNGNTLNVIALLDETTASALSFLNEVKSYGEKRILTIDLGGSLNASVMDASAVDGSVRIDPVATVGFTEYSGSLINAAMAAYAEERYRKEVGELSEYALEDDGERAFRQRETESTKLRLSKLEKTKMRVSYDSNKYAFDYSREELNKVAAPIFDKMLSALETALHDNAVELSTIDEILLVGGASRMPLLKKAVNERLGLPVITYTHGCSSAHGSAIAARAFAQKEPTVEISRICPYSMGLRAYQNDELVVVNPVRKNTRLPLSEKRRFATVGEAMPVLNIYLYENSSVNDTVSLDECSSQEKPVSVYLERGLPTRIPIEVTFNVDENGILSITVKDLVTNIEKKVM